MPEEEGTQDLPALEPPRPLAPSGPWRPRLDFWMSGHPWRPRATPYLVYVIFLLPIALCRSWWNVNAYPPIYYPVIYGLQCAAVGWLLWRYRRHCPELTVRFDLLAVPTAVAVAAAWIALGRWLTALFPQQFAAHETHYFQQMTGPLLWLSLGLRLVGMSVVVPLFEELFTRSLLLRGLSSARQTAAGLLQLLIDQPVAGPRLLARPAGRWAMNQGPVFRKQFEQTPLGRLTPFGVAASTLIFTAAHAPRDWPAAVLCGLAYCLLLAATKRKGLGPTVCAHGLTNALLWGYSVHFGDFRFM